MRVFITGGTGFIGKHVVDKLIKDKHEILLLSRKKERLQALLNVIKGDLKEIDKWKKKLFKFKPDAAIHLGWEGLPSHEYSLSKNNFFNSLRLWEVLTEIRCKKIIAVGSCWEYGVQSGKLDEDFLPGPFDTFTAAKHSLRWFGKSLARNKEVEFIWTRPFYVYGPGQHKKSLIPHLIEAAKNNRQPEIRTPDASNDFIFVEDLADAYAALLTSNLKHDLYNIGSGKLTKVADIIKIVFREFNVEVNFKNADTDNRSNLKNFYADISRIKKETEWRPAHTITDGVKKTIAASR